MKNPNISLKINRISGAFIGVLCLYTHTHSLSLLRRVLGTDGGGEDSLLCRENNFTCKYKYCTAQLVTTCLIVELCTSCTYACIEHRLNFPATSQTMNYIICELVTLRQYWLQGKRGEERKRADSLQSQRVLFPRFGPYFLHYTALEIAVDFRFSSGEIFYGLTPRYLSYLSFKGF